MCKQTVVLIWKWTDSIRAVEMCFLRDSKKFDPQEMVGNENGYSIHLQWTEGHRSP